MGPKRARGSGSLGCHGRPVATTSRRVFLRLGGLGLAGAVLSNILPGIFDSRSIATANAATNTVALGAYVPSLPWDFTSIDEYSDLVGKWPAIIHWFQDWVMDFEPEYLDGAVARGGTPLISWEPWRFGEGLDQSGYVLRNILAGDHDVYIHQWSRAAALWGKTFYLRFAHEMNSDWTTWSPGIKGNTSREYIAVWRKVYRIFQQEGATNAVWVWAPVAHYEGATPYRDVYPGDAYVDWLGVSGYNWGDTRPWSQWQSFYRIFVQSYDILVRLTNKQIMVPETASAESGGDKAAWIRNAFLKQIPAHFPRIKAVVWFHADKENDWRINSSDGSLQHYRDVVASGRYQGRLSV